MDEQNFLKDFLTSLGYTQSDILKYSDELSKLIQSETLLMLVDSSQELRNKITNYSDISEPQKIYDTAKEYYSAEEITMIHRKATEKILTSFIKSFEQKN